MEGKKKKPVGIMGWHQMYNFGSQLQLTALTYIIRQMGYEPEIINYKPKQEMYRVRKNIFFVIYRMFRKLHYVGNPEYLSDIKRNIFESYKKENLCFTQTCDLSSDLYMLNDLFEAFVCGSDQIWNPYYGDDKYFLNFVEDARKKIAYGVSFGVDMLPNQYVSGKYQKLLKDFSLISIREIQGKEMLSRLGIRDVPVVLDPTLLLDMEKWNDLFQIQSSGHGDYILCYFLGDIRRHLKYINKIRNKLQKKVIVIVTRERDLKLPFEMYSEIGPKEFIVLMQGACFVCTDSFHGVCFSVIYKKNFWVFERFKRNQINNQNCRIDSVLKILDLEHRKIDGKRSELNELQIEWREVEKNLTKMRKKSYNYLQKALYTAFAATNKLHVGITNTCCGCGACQAVCKYNAIEMLKDCHGDSKAQINMKQCVQCGECKKVCPFREKENLTDIVCTRYYSFQSKNKEVLMRSSSGGASYEILQHLSQQGYLIYGCVYDNESESAIHKRLKREDLYRTQGSKYLNSDTCNVMKEIFQSKKKFVFVGTPCQVSAVDKILKNRGMRKSAVLIDLVCHGVPTNSLWYRYLCEIKEKLHTSKSVNIVFREKKYGWRNRVMVIEGKEGGKYKRNSTRDLFYCFYNQGNCLEEQCYECCFKTKTAADIRIGDYWGNKYRFNKKGVSRVFSVSPIGDHIIDSLKERGSVKEFSIKEFFMEENCVNLVKPVYYDSLQEELENQKPLKKLKKIYCDGWYIRYLYRLKGFITSYRS